MDTENRTTINWNSLIQAIQSEKCILLLGPEICLSPENNTTFSERVINQLRESPHVKRYYEGEELFLFHNGVAKTDAYCEIIKSNYEQDVIEDIYVKIAQIPFHLMISTSPDIFLRKVFEQHQFSHQFAYLSRGMIEDIEKPTSENPLIYNLMGSVDDEESLILTHDDLFEFLAAILGDKKLPQNMMTALSKAKIKQLIFLGFQLDKWYMHLLLRMLELSKYKDDFRLYASGDSFNENVRSFCIDHFNITFVEHEPQKFINKLYEKCREYDMQTNDPIKFSMRKLEEKAMISDFQPEIFISYALGEGREEIVDQLYAKMIEKGYNVIRDKANLGYKGKIKEFMARIGRGKYVIVVISDKYLKSPNCMFEVLEIEKNKNLYDRIFPVVLSDAKVYNAIDRIDYIIYWRNEADRLNEKIKSIGDISYTDSLQKTLNQYSDIRRIIANFVALISDINALTSQMHIEQNFSELLKAIDRRIVEDTN